MSIKPELKSGVLGLIGNLAKRSNPDLVGGGMWKLDGFNLNEANSIAKVSGMDKYHTKQLIEGGTPATFTGLFEYQKVDGVLQQIAATTKQIYALTGSDVWGAVGIADRTGTSRDLSAATTINDLFIIGNGVDPNIMYDGVTTYNLGISAPVSAPVATAGNAGPLIGVYSYMMTYVNTTLQHESNPTDVSNDVTVDNQEIVLSGLPTSDDPQVDARRLYRTTTGGAIYLLVAEVPNNGVDIYTDNVPDTDLGIAVDQFGNGVPAPFSICAVLNGSVFMAAPNSSDLYFTKVNFPNAQDADDFRSLGKNDGESITAIKNFLGFLVIFKDGSIWQSSGSDRTSYAFDRIVSNVGALNQQCVLTLPTKTQASFGANNALIFMDKMLDSSRTMEFLLYLWGWRFNPCSINSIFRRLNTQLVWFISRSISAAGLFLMVSLLSAI